MNQDLRKIPFDIYLPATAESEARKVETIEVEVYRIASRKCFRHIAT